MKKTCSWQQQFILFLLALPFFSSAIIAEELSKESLARLIENSEKAHSSALVVYHKGKLHDRAA